MRPPALEDRLLEGCEGLRWPALSPGDDQGVWCSCEFICAASGWRSTRVPLGCDEQESCRI